MNKKVLYFYNLGKILLFQNRNTKQILLKNTFWLFFGEGVAKLILLLIVILTTRYLGVENYGKLSFALAFTGIFGVFTDFGFNNYITREISQNPNSAKKYIDNILIIKLLLGLITLLVISGCLQFLHKSSDVNILVYLAAIYTLIQSFIIFFQFIFQSFEKMQYTFITRVLYTVCLLIILLITIYQRMSIQAIVLDYIIASSLSFVIAIFLMRRYFTKFFIEFDFKFYKKIIMEAWPFFAGVICIGIYTNLDTTLVSIFRNYKEVGLYRAADNILTAFLTFTLAHQVLYPKFAALYGQEKIVTYKKIAKKAILVSILLLIPISILISMFSTQALQLIYGADFRSANIALVFLIWTGILIYFSSFWGNSLMISNNQKKWFHAVLIGAGVNIILNFVFIPLFGYIAAAIITFLSELFIFILSYYLCPKDLRNFFVYN